jgi:16S rRNA (adenine1518-N6/adenine1519-N6)-dimethyltransferase
MNYSPKYMSEFLNKKNFNFKKKFGQNFIVDENIIKKMVDNANIDKDTLVIEIGPGAGSLTYFLAEKAKCVFCYEIDNTLEEVLKENLKEYSNVTIKFEDFLKSNIKEDLKNFNYKKLYIVANLPYYITTPIIMKIIDDSIPADKIQVMVQKEVGDRFKAKPGSKDYNSLSIYLNYYFDVDKVMDISRNVFLPKPNVDSIVVEFTKKDKKLELNNEKIFFKLIKDSFVQKRKTLKNNLKNYDLDKIEEVLKKYNMDLSVRAENVPDYVFAEISNKIGE